MDYKKIFQILKDIAFVISLIVLCIFIYEYFWGVGYYKEMALGSSASGAFIAYYLLSDKRYAKKT